jgi:hypothetical protein
VGEAEHRLLELRRLPALAAVGCPLGA